MKKMEKDSKRLFAPGSFFVDEVIILKGAIDDIVSDPETKRRIYNRASALMDRRKNENEQNNRENEKGKTNLH